MDMSSGSISREYSMYTVMAAMPVRREETCLQFFWLLASSSSFPAHSLPTLASANSEKSKAAFIVMEVEAIWYCMKRAWALQADAVFVGIPFSLLLVAM